MTSHLIQTLRDRFPSLTILPEEPLARHTSFRIGGAADALLLPASAEQLEALCLFLRSAGEQPLLMGNGSNLLVGDAPLHRLVIKTAECAATVTAPDGGTVITADCGALLGTVAAAALRSSLRGMEFASGIPGTVGGAVMMNAGAYGGEIRQIAVRTEYLDEQLIKRVAAGEEQKFSYRHSLFCEKDCVILRTMFSLQPGNKDAIARQMKELAARRRESQPLEFPSAGSTFKRPAAGYAAAMIDAAGLKGLSVGDAMVSPKHAGFVINTGNATCEDVLRLMDRVREEVKKHCGVELEPEVRIWR